MHPGRLLADIDMGLRRDRAGIVEGGGMQMDLARPALALIGERRAALAAEGARHAGRGVMVLRGIAAPAQLIGGEARIGGIGGADRPPAVTAMAVRGPFRVAAHFVADGATAAAASKALGRFNHGATRRVSDLGTWFAGRSVREAARRGQ